VGFAVVVSWRALELQRAHDRHVRAVPREAVKQYATSVIARADRERRVPVEVRWAAGDVPTPSAPHAVEAR
jgi:hypothetical protein